jgi:acetyltransferase
MAAEPLELAFHPRSIAVVGASAEPLSFGNFFLQHLVNYGFRGRIYPVTPKWPEILGHKAYPALKDVPGTVDYVICCLPAAKVADLLKECPGKGVRVVHLFTGRFGETGKDEAAAQEKAILRLATELGVRLVGPNCMGIYNPEAGISFGHDFPTEPGRLGMFFQSGGSASEFIYYASLRGIRFSKVASYGNALDIDEAEILAYLAEDDATDVIAGYVEGIRDGRKFLDALRRTTPKKPVILLKVGRGSAGAESAASHTASLAGSFPIWESAVRQAGAVQAETLADMADLAVTFYCLPPIRSTRVGILGGGGGQSVLSADEWDVGGFDVVPLPDDIEEVIRERLPELWWGWIRNPVDQSLLPMEVLGTDLSPEILMRMARSDSLDLVVANTAVGGPFSKSHLAAYVELYAQVIIEAGKTGKNPVVAVLDTGASSPREFDDERWRGLYEARTKLVAAGIPVYASARRAARSIHRLVKYHQWRDARTRFSD